MNEKSIEEAFRLFKPDKINGFAFAESVQASGELQNISVDGDFDDPNVNITLNYKLSIEQFIFVLEHSKKEEGDD